MVTKDEALKEAYETLKDIAENATSYEDGWCGAAAEEVLPAIEAALAQPAQEPVAFAVVGEWKFGIYEIGKETETDLSVCKYWENRGYTLIPLYTTPPQRPWVGLTMEEFLYILDNCRTPSTYLSMVEAKLKEKNS